MTKKVPLCLKKMNRGKSLQEQIKGINMWLNGMGVLQEQNHHTHKPKATSMFIQGLKVYVEPLKHP
jgi:hypothetical protein